MLKKIALLCLFITTVATAQEHDPKAKSILDDASKLSKSYKTVMAEYTLITTNKEKKQVDKQNGKIQLKGNKFRIEIPGNTIVCDGKTVWTHNKDANEVSIKNFEPGEDGIDPTKIFTLYEKGYKYKYEKEEKIGNVTYHVINLYPEKPEKKKFHTIKIYIDKVSKQVKILKILNKDGGAQSYELKNIVPNKDLADTQFTFDTKAFKPDQVIDER